MLRAIHASIASLALVALAAATTAALAQAPADTAAARPHAVSRPGPPPFGPGEQLVFSIDYGLVNAGEGVLEVLGTVDYEGHECWSIESTARSNRFFSNFYKVRDKVVSYIDGEGLFSRYFMKRLREGDYKKTVEIHFDHAAGKARYENGKEYDIPAGVHDVLSSFYYVRTLDLEVGRDVLLSAHSSRKTYDLRVLVLRRETVETDLGTFDCFVVQPIMEDEGLFKHEGDLTIYLTADERRIPVLMQTKLPVGHIDATLTRFRLADGTEGGHD